MTTRAQLVMLFGFWRRAKAVLMHGRETWTGDEETRRRRELTVRALGREKSWKALTNPDVDKIKAELMAVIDPSDARAQIRQAGMEKTRLYFGLRKLMRELGKDENFVRGVIEQIDNGVDPNSTDASWQRDRERSTSRRQIEDLSACELKQVMSALHSIRSRGAQKKPDRIYHLQPASAN